MENYYVLNLETTKLELHFERETYTSLSNDEKREIKSAFLWSRFAGCWVSRAKEPNLWRAYNIAKKLNLEDGGKEGERLSFAEQMERKQERAESRADRYAARAEKAQAHGEQLQSAINSRHGDIAFFTQPNINTSAGRAFTRQREKMFAAFERGFKEFQRSEYWKERAQIAATTAEGKELKNKGFIQRRIDECERNIRALKRNYDNDAANADYYAERIETQLDKLGFYQAALEKLGGIEYDKSNLKKGDIIYISRYQNEPLIYVRGGTKNFTFDFTNLFYADGITPWRGKASYAEIERVEKKGV